MAGTYISVPGSNNFDVKVYGKGTVIAGGGNDSIDITGRGKIVVGAGHDTLTLEKGGVISQLGAAGRDTISIGNGTTTIHEDGQATISGMANTASAFGSATLFGGEVKIIASERFATDMAVSGKATLIGTAAPTEFIGGSGSASMVGGKGDDTFIGGTGHDTLVGGKGPDLFEFTRHNAGGQHVIQDFVSGTDELYVEGHSLEYLKHHNDITTHGGNTYISLDGGKTTIELKGVTDLKASDINTHKH